MKKFTRTIEDFTCEQCGVAVSGNGFTNHCPKCLWSKHVDIHPGDRAEECGGMMKPVGLEKRGDDFYITHQCQQCGFERRNKFGAPDDFEELLKIGKKST